VMISPTDRSLLSGDVSPTDRSLLSFDVSPTNRSLLSGDVSRDMTALAATADGLAATSSGPHSSHSFDCSAQVGQNRAPWQAPS
jgi:hypothetical protein